MDATFVTSVYVILDEIVKAVLEPVKYKPKIVSAEILLAAMLAARYFHNNLERAWVLMQQTGYVPQARGLSISRYNRQLHRYATWLEFGLETLMALARAGDVFIIDSMPAPVCKRKRAWPVLKFRLGLNEIFRAERNGGAVTRTVSARRCPRDLDRSCG